MLLKLAINRLTLHRNKNFEASNVHKKEIADMMEHEKEEQARVRVFHIPYLIFICLSFYFCY